MNEPADTSQTLLEKLTGASLVHIDARVLALHLLGDEAALSSQVDGVMEALKSGAIKAQTSSLSLYQILAEVYRSGKPGLAGEVAKALQVYTGLSMVPATPDVAVQAAEVRAQLGGRPERALQIATALVADAEVYLTTRSGLKRIAGMSVLNLEDYPTGGRSR